MEKQSRSSFLCNNLKYFTEKILRCKYAKTFCQEFKEWGSKHNLIREGVRIRKGFILYKEDVIIEQLKRAEKKKLAYIFFFLKRQTELI